MRAVVGRVVVIRVAVSVRLFPFARVRRILIVDRADAVGTFHLVLMLLAREGGVLARILCLTDLPILLRGLLALHERRLKYRAREWIDLCHRRWRAWGAARAFHKSLSADQTLSEHKSA